MNNSLISCCGLNCAECDAHIATMHNDNALRQKTAEAWSQQYQATLTYQMINCTGCRQEGAKFAHCSECEVRNCAQTKGYSTCGDCSELESCSIVGSIHQFVPGALENLKMLNT